MKMINFLNIIIEAFKAFFRTFVFEINTKGFVCELFTNESIKKITENIKFSIFKRQSPGSLYNENGNYYIQLNPEYNTELQKLLIVTHEIGHYLTKEFKIGIRTLYLESYSDLIGVCLTHLETNKSINELSMIRMNLLLSYGKTEEHLKRIDNISYFNFLLEKEKISIKDVIDPDTLKININKLHSSLLIKE